MGGRCKSSSSSNSSSKWQRIRRKRRQKQHLSLFNALLLRRTHHCRVAVSSNASNALLSSVAVASNASLLRRTHICCRRRCRLECIPVASNTSLSLPTHRCRRRHFKHITVEGVTVRLNTLLLHRRIAVEGIAVASLSCRTHHWRVKCIAVVGIAVASNALLSHRTHRCRVERIAAKGVAVASNVSLLKVSLSLKHIDVASNTSLLKVSLSRHSHVETHCCCVLL